VNLSMENFEVSKCVSDGGERWNLITKSKKVETFEPTASAIECQECRM